MDNSDERRDAIHAALQEIGPTDLSSGAVLTGWVLVTEWMDPDGERWISKGHSASLAAWSADGFHHQALYGNWGDDS